MRKKKEKKPRLKRGTYSQLSGTATRALGTALLERITKLEQSAATQVHIREAAYRLGVTENLVELKRRELENAESLQVQASNNLRQVIAESVHKVLAPAGASGTGNSPLAVTASWHVSEP